LSPPPNSAGDMPEITLIPEGSSDMIRKLSQPMSRLKKKLLIYFILIAIVSISVSAEIILEVSSLRFKNSISSNFIHQVENNLGKKSVDKLMKEIDAEAVFVPINNLRNRMILFLLVVSASIIGAFYMFTKDIISPMDGIVEATKKIAKGDLTVSVPVMSEDEIGQIAGLINDMNLNLQDMIFQVKQEVTRYKDKIEIATHRISELVNEQVKDEVMESRKMKVSDFKKMVTIGNEVVGLLEYMSNDLTSLQTFINMYKTYKINSEISQNEIEEALKNFSSDTLGR
jgi:methyl-accepting chemotaxis protein